MRIQRTARSAFTIVEMMVATALILFLMAIIAQAFGAASKTFNTMRTAGNLQEKLRTTSGVIRKDMASEHFAGPYVAGRSGPRLGDQLMHVSGWVPPNAGYVMIRQGSNTIYEPVQEWNAGNQIKDAEGLYSSRADGTNGGTVFQFTVKLADLPAAELFCADFDPTLASIPQINSFPVAGQSRLYSRWAEVQYFLIPNGDSTKSSSAGPSLTLYSLRRRVRLLAPKSFSAEVPAGTFVNLEGKYPDVAVKQFPSPNMGMEIIRVYGPEDVANPANRLQYPPQIVQKNGVDTGDDILQTDVTSFEVKPAWFNNQNWNTNIVAGSSPLARDIVNGGNSDYPFDDVPVNALNTTLGGQRVFDTYYRAGTADSIDWDRASNQADGNGRSGFLTPRADQLPVRINVRAIQIKIRVYDSKAEQSRQVTIVQEM